MFKKELIIGGKYRLANGKDYKVLHITKDRSSNEDVVIFQKLNGDKGIWAKPLKTLNEKVKVDGKIVNMFEEIN